MNHRLRLIIIAVVMFAWAGIIFSRLFVLQYQKYDEFSDRAIRQYQSKIKLNPKRGTIFDRDGKILAINVDVPSVYAIPEEIENPAEVAATLAPILDLSKNFLEKRLARKSSFVWLKRKVEPEIKTAIEEHDFRGIAFVTESKRMYPFSNLASHVLGFVGIDNDGLAGVEYSYDTYLKGNEGMMLGIRGAKRGYDFSSGKVIKQPTGGNDIQLTINSRIQFIVEQEIKKHAETTGAESITVVAMDPFTGEMLAMANYPDYDPNRIGDYDDFARKNRAVVDAYEPGSTFKIITAAAAFEANVVTLDDMFDCENGSIAIGGRVIRDHNPFGVMSFREVMEHSSNVGTIKVGALVGEDRLWNMADKFGYGHGTGIDLPGENRGILRPTSKWSANSYGSIAIGQEVSGSPVQILQNISIVANGGYWIKPYIVANVRDSSGKVVFQHNLESRKIVSDSTIDLLKDITKGVVTTGGGTLASIQGIQAAGKTGTGEIAAPGRGYIPGAYLASFAGFFPFDEPRVAMLCIVVRPKGKYYGGQIGAPLFAAISEKIANELELRRSDQYHIVADILQNDSNLTHRTTAEQVTWKKRVVPDYKQSLIMPNVMGLDLKSAVARLAEFGVIPRVVGNGKVTRQFPQAGQTVNDETVLYCGGTGVALNR